MILSYRELLALVEAGVVGNLDEAQINGASIDLTIGDTIMVEDDTPKSVDLLKRESVSWKKVSIENGSYALKPGEFILAHSREDFRLPLHITSFLFTKSSIGRNGLDHMQAGFCDPGWHGKLTFEFKNETRNHTLIIRPGLPVAQLAFFSHSPVPADASYAARGRYNGDDTVMGSKP